MANIENRTTDEKGADLTGKKEERAAKTRRVLSASSLAKDGVRNPAGDSLGKIEDLMIDIPTGRIAYAVLSFGGFLGMGNKLFAVPWDALTLDEVEHEFVLNVDKKTLEDAPGFDKDHWPDMADRDFGSRVFSHYGYKPYWESESTTVKKEEVRDREQTLKGGGGI